MASLTDWFARTLYGDVLDEEGSAAVAANHQRLLDQQREEGKVGALKYMVMSEEIADTGAKFYDEELGKSGVAGLPGVGFTFLSKIPWWLWLLVIGGAAFYFWPILRPFAGRLLRRFK